MIRFHNLVLIPKRYLRAVRIASTSRLSNNKQIKNDDSNIENINSSNNISEPMSESCNYLALNEKEDFHNVHGNYRNENSRNNNIREQIEIKYKPLLQPNFKNNNKETRQKISLMNVRLDSENVPQKHGQYEYSDEISFKTFQDVVRHLNEHQIEIKNETTERKEINQKTHPEIDFDVDENIEYKPSSLKCSKSILEENIKFKYAGQLFTSKQTNKNENSEELDWISYEREKREPKETKKKEELSLSEKIAQVKLEQKSIDNDRPQIISGYEYLKQIRLGKRLPIQEKEFNELKQLIQKEKLDSKGYKVLTNQTPDYSKLTNQEVLDMLIKQILYNNDDIVALNKPYGMAIHGAFGAQISTSRINSKYNQIIHLNYFLPDLAKHLNCDRLYTVHRLDRDTTGVLLLTKTQEKAKQLNELFKERKIQKKYICITKNKPDHQEGLIDIPIELGFIKSSNGQKRERMVLCPEPMENIRIKRRWRNAKKAITYFKIKSFNGNAALLEVTPETGLKHQIRVHLGFGLRCPILGDHKYSNMDSLAPQKLPSDILMALRVRQAKSRTVPMHLHSYLLMIPQANDNGTSNIFIRAPLPYHFKKNMSLLNLKFD